MAKRMQFSVVGLPHYTIWHLYEPSVDDIRHMEEMEQERKAREAEEEERQERMKKIKDQFADPNGQWEKDKTDIQNEAMREKKAQEEKEKEKQAQDDTKPSRDETEAQAAAAQSPELVEVRSSSLFHQKLYIDQTQGSKPS
jgi:mannan polymerase II complex ANP1 subunit